MSHTLPNDPTTAIRVATERIEPALIEIRRDIHAHPELGFEEVRTAGVVARELTRLGIKHQTGIGKTGIVGLIEGGRPGKVLAIRADMDALPIEERTGLPFASQTKGLMHACGHDIHTTTLLGVAAVLKDLAPQLAGTVKLVFQPAEEGVGGMRAMLADGLLEDGLLDAPKIDVALGFHNYPDLPVGRFGYVHGPCLAAADRFDIVVHGRSGHAAWPHVTIDPLVAAASLVVQLQTIVSREVPPMFPAVLTVGMIQGGTTYNIIPDSCAIKGTVRTLHAPARDIIEAAIGRLAAGLEAGMRVTCAVDYHRGVPSLVNDDTVLEPTIAAVRRQFGDVADEGQASLGGEDFALLSALVPGFQLRVGSGAPGRNDELHNSDYQPDERCIGLGVQALSRAALEILGPVRLCVYGAGAVGGYLAGFLARGGAKVSVVARGAHLAAIRADGLRVETPDEALTVRVAASDDPAELGPQDAVLVTVKAPALAEVAARIGPLLGHDTPVAFVMNGIPWWYFHALGTRPGGARADAAGGVSGDTAGGEAIPLLDPDGALARSVGARRAIGGVFWPACSVPRPGVVRLLTGAGRGTSFGEPDGSDSPRLEALAGAFRAAGLPVTLSDRIRALIWHKLVFNLSAGPMCVLTETAVKETHTEPALVEASRALLREAMALADAMGFPVELDIEQVVATNTRLAHRPSILQDLEAGRRMEIDALYSVPLQMARAVGVAMPTLEMLAALIRVKARGRGLY